MSKFINRVDEMNILNNEYSRDGASFVVIYGRRRVGKTTLINHFCEDKNALYFLATEESEKENRNALKELVSQKYGNELLASASLDSWTPIFKIIAEESQKGRIVLVIDEFQYLCKANKSFASVMQKVWDEILSKADIMLILCGSLINMMTSQVLNYASPLYGRRTAQIKLKQISFSHYHEFDDAFSIDEQIRHYAVTGGVPKYIELFSKKKDVFVSIKENILSSGAFLYAEPEFLLQKEVSEIGSYFSILKTIASGNRKLGNIAGALGVSQSNLTTYLKTLIDLDILEREVPITEENPEKSKMGLYRIKDNFLTFWFKFVYPNRGLLESGQTKYVEEKIKKHFIDSHVAFVYEDICREAVWNLLSDSLSFNRVGRWWGSKDVEIDIVAYDSMGTDILFGECKYSNRKKGFNVLNDLQQKALAVNWNRDSRRESYVIYSKSGFTDELLEYADQHDNIYLKQL